MVEAVLVLQGACPMEVVLRIQKGHTGDKTRDSWGCGGVMEAQRRGPLQR